MKLMKLMRLMRLRFSLAIQLGLDISEGVHHFGLPFLELFPSREVLPASKSVA